MIKLYKEILYSTLVCNGLMSFSIKFTFVRNGHMSFSVKLVLTVVRNGHMSFSV